MTSSNIKATAIVVGTFVLILVIIIAPFAISSINEEQKTNFPNYTNLKIKESDVIDPNSASYGEIKSRLENDYYFIKETLISNYNYKNYTGENIQKMLWNFIFAYELNNTKYLSAKTNGKFCMRSKYVVKAFEELYGVNIGLDSQYLDGYVNYVTYSKNRYCFNYEEVANEYSDTIKILIDGIEVKDDVVKLNAYVYEFYTAYTRTEKAFISELEEAIKYSNISEANKIVTNNLNGKVTHKQFEFKVNNNADFFKYQILSSKNLEY